MNSPSFFLHIKRCCVPPTLENTVLDYKENTSLFSGYEQTSSDVSSGDMESCVPI